LQSVSESIKQLNPATKVEIYAIDLQDHVAVDRAVKDSIEKLGGIDILVNNVSFLVNIMVSTNVE
jgi:short-subunit dehydrogenase